jgi:quercetin dioxygenase-like cupin family protein
MKSEHVATALGALKELVVTGVTTEEDAQASMRALHSFNGCMVGVVRFSGRTPWERHQGDELLYVLQGSVDVTVLADSGPLHAALRTGDVFVVPRDLWHRQHAPETTGLLFVTSETGNAVSDAEDPRAEA